MPDIVDTLHYPRLKKPHNISQTGSAGGMDSGRTYSVGPLERVGLCHSHYLVIVTSAY